MVNAELVQTDIRMIHADALTDLMSLNSEANHQPFSKVLLLPA